MMDQPKENSIPAKKKDKKARKKIAKISRWLHIYLSMLSFAIVLFFSITGLTLNHADFFAGKTISTKDTGTLNMAWVQAKDTNLIAKLNIAEYFRNKYQVKGAVTEFRIDNPQISISFRGPGYEGDAFISRETGAYELSQTRGGFIAFMNDLHKGRDTGNTWSWVIDVSAIFLVVISLSGLVLLLFIRKKKASGLILLLIGCALVCILYKFFGQ